MENQDKIESNKSLRKSAKSYKSFMDIFSDKPNLTIHNPVIFVLAFVVWAGFIWYFIASIKTQSFQDKTYILFILAIFSYGLFISIKNKFK